MNHKQTQQEARRARLRAALKGDAYSEPFMLGDMRVCMRLVPEVLKNRAVLEVHAHIAEQGYDAERAAALHNSMSLCRVLAHALVDAQSRESVATAEDLGDLIPTPVLLDLAERYDRFEALHSPKTAADMDALWAEVQEYVGNGDGALQDFFSTLDFGTLVNLSSYMAARLTS